MGFFDKLKDTLKNHFADLSVSDWEGEEKKRHYAAIDAENQKKEEEFQRQLNALINRLETGTQPPISPSISVILKKGEQAYLQSSDVELIEERVIDRKYVGGSHGISFRVMKGVSYRVGNSKGHVETTKGNVVVDIGDILITNKRCIFKGRKKSFSVNLAKILDIELYSDAVVIHEENKQNPRIIGVDESAQRRVLYTAIRAYTQFAQS